MQSFVALPARDEYTVAQFDGSSMLVAESHYPPALRIDDAARTLAVEGAAFEMLAVLIRLAGAQRLKPPAWLARAHELVHDRFRDPLTIAGLAAEAGVHPVHFARSFREHYGVAPAALVRRLRIRWAADRVRTTSDSLGTIAAEAGFYDQPHFARMFREIVGVSPSQFRSLISS